MRYAQEWRPAFGNEFIEHAHADHCRLQLQLALKKDPSYAPARELLADLDSPPATPNAPEASQVLPAGYVQPDGQ